MVSIRAWAAGKKGKDRGKVREEQGRSPGRGREALKRMLVKTRACPPLLVKWVHNRRLSTENLKVHIFLVYRCLTNAHFLHHFIMKKRTFKSRLSQ